MRNSFSLCRSKTHGFTLAELAVFMGVVGVVLGVVWTAATSLSNSNKAYLATQEVAQVAQNIREFYMNAQGIPLGAASCGGDVTSALASVGNSSVFPSNMRHLVSGTTYTVYNPYNYKDASGSFRVLGGSACTGTTANRFQIVLTDLSAAACERLVFSGVNYKDQTFGITQICAGTTCHSGTGWKALGCNSGVCGLCASPVNGVCSTVPTLVTIPQAQTLCAGTGSTNEVGWEFKVRD